MNESGCSGVGVAPPPEGSVRSETGPPGPQWTTLWPTFWREALMCDVQQCTED
jgi:hypothetical protein